jgi:hypothetical protein
MIPNDILSNLTPVGRVAILPRGGEAYFLVHPASDDPDAIRACVEREGSESLTSHVRAHAAILEFVAGRMWDVGGEG